MDNGYTPHGQANGNGRDVLAGLQPGNYKVDVSANGKSSSQTVTLQVGQTATLNIPLEGTSAGTPDANATTLYPGGVLNTGFAVAWALERQQNAQPATGPGHGQSWAYQQIQDGHLTSRANQVLHGLAQDPPKPATQTPHYPPAGTDPPPSLARSATPTTTTISKARSARWTKACGRRTTSS